MPGMRFKKDIEYSCKCCSSAGMWNDKNSRTQERKEVRRIVREETANER